MKTILFLIFFILELKAFSRAPKVKWSEGLGGSALDVATSIRETPDHGFIVGGSSQSTDGEVTGNHGSSDCWVVKLDSNGNLQWEKSYGGSDWDELSTIRVTSDEGYIFTGKSYSDDGDVTGHHGNKGKGDVWVVKLDNNGDIEWEHSYGGTSEENAFDILQTLDGGYVVAAATWSNDGDVTGHHGTDHTSDYWIIKLDSIGNIQWEKCYGGGVNEQPCTVLQGPDGGYFVAGYSTSRDGDVSTHHGTEWVHNVWIVKLNAMGALVFEKVMPNSLDQTPYSACFSKEGGYIIAGSGFGFPGHKIFDHGEGDMMLMKLSKNGRLDTACDIGGTSLDVAHYISPTDDGGYVIAGSSESGFWVVKVNSLLRLQWEDRPIFTSGNAYAIQQTDKDDYIVAGDKNSTYGTHNSTDFWIVKLGHPKNEDVARIPQAQHQFLVPTMSLLSNPVISDIRLNYFCSDHGLIELDDLTGRTLFAKPAVPGDQSISIDVSDIPKGFYLLSLITPERQITKKVEVTY